MEAAYEVRLKTKDGTIRNRRVFAKSRSNAMARVGDNDRIIGVRKVQIDDILDAEVKKITAIVRKEGAGMKWSHRENIVITESTTIDSVLFSKNKIGGIRKQENIERFKDKDSGNISELLK